MEKPSVLVISLKRFNNSVRKDQRLVTFNLENMDLSKYVKGYDKNSYVYDLYGICNHGGNTWGGHYTAYVKNADNNWYHFNDTQVSKLTSNIEHNLISPRAYCLFYQKKNVI